MQNEETESTRRHDDTKGIRTQPPRREERQGKRTHHKDAKGLGAYVQGILLLNDAELQGSRLAFVAHDGEIGPGRNQVPG